MLQESTLRIYRPESGTNLDLGTLMGCRELIRPSDAGRTDRRIEPFTRSWYEELEHKRYVRQGEWLPRALEFSRHSGESLLMLGPGLGTDAIQYQRHETHVTICTTAADQPEMIRRNFDLRGLSLNLVQSTDADALPFARGAFDLAYWSLLDHSDTTSPAFTSRIDELYRVLKPGGKLFVLAPAWYDVTRWQRWLLPLNRWYWQSPQRPSSGTQWTASQMRTSFKKFHEMRIVKRHLRRSELPHPWRVLPTSLLECLLGRVLVLRGFKPLSAALERLSEAA